MPRKRKYSTSERRAYYVGFSRGSGVDEKHIDRNSDVNFMTYDDKHAVAYYRGIIDGKSKNTFSKSNKKFKKFNHNRQK